MSALSIVMRPDPLDEFETEAPAPLADRIAPVRVPDAPTVKINKPRRFSFRRLSWLAAIAAILFAGYSGVEVLREAHTGSEQAARVAITLMIAIVPYLFARSVDQLARADELARR